MLMNLITPAGREKLCKTTARLIRAAFVSYFDWCSDRTDHGKHCKTVARLIRVGFESYFISIDALIMPAVVNYARPLQD